MNILNSDIEDAVYYTRTLLHEWTDKEFEHIKKQLIAQQEAFDFKFVVALCVYNEEQFLADALETCLQFVDLDGIYILDGAWKDGGSTFTSTDNTQAIATNFAKTHPDIKVVIHESPMGFWRTEGEKRNSQLKIIEDIWGKAYVFILDGDEQIKTNSGQTRHWMKHELHEKFNKVGIIRGYARGSKSHMDAVRLIPTKYGYHYHTEYPMIIHDKYHNVIMDYEFNHGERWFPLLFDFNNFRIINNLNIRTRERTIEKQAYVDSLPETWGECKWTT